jgi:hypothetical protein
MYRSLLLASLSVAALAGCGHTTYRETVVEKQPIVTRETVVERPTIAPPASTVVAVPTTGPGCALNTAAYGNGTLSCQAGMQYQCINGVWQPLSGSSC